MDAYSLSPMLSWARALMTNSQKAWTHMADNQYNLQMAQIGVQTLEANNMFRLGSMQIEAQKEMAFEKFETSLKVARLDYRARMDEQENEHKVAMRELDVREREIELQYQQANSVSRDDMLA